jgi:hypothetical protein
VPFWVAGQFLSLFPLVVTDLINLSVSNSQINDLAELYAETQHEIREFTMAALQSLVGPHVDPSHNAALRDLAAHSDLLESYLKIERVKSKLGGYVVGFGMVRTVLATTLTVLVALWTVLRAAGVVFTMESVCLAP